MIAGVVLTGCLAAEPSRATPDCDAISLMADYSPLRGKPDSNLDVRLVNTGSMEVLSLPLWLDNTIYLFFVDADGAMILTRPSAAHPTWPGLEDKHVVTLLPGGETNASVLLNAGPPPENASALRVVFDSARPTYVTRGYCAVELSVDIRLPNRSTGPEAGQP